MKYEIEYIEKIVIYKWNKIYPAELFFDLSDMLVAENMTEQREFVGFSHEKITKEVYEI